MLVLSRKERETIYVGDVVVTVTKIDGNRVRLGIDAPEGTAILRGELVEGKDGEGE